MNEPLGPCRILRCGGIELPEETQSHARKTRPPPPCYQPTALLFVTFFFFFFFPFSILNHPTAHARLPLPQS